MKVSVSFESKLYTAYVMQGEEKALDDMKSDLVSYFESNRAVAPCYLGKDAPFKRPENITDAELHHIHMFVDGVSCKSRWNQKNTSDTYIVYTFGYMNEEAYQVIDIIGENAHEVCRSDSRMRDYKVHAEDFRDKN
jgi:hypothetical protein